MILISFAQLIFIMFNAKHASSKCMLRTLDEYYESAEAVLKLKVKRKIKQKDENYNKYRAKWLKTYKGCPPETKKITIASTTSSVGLFINVGNIFYFFADVVVKGNNTEYRSTLCDGSSTQMDREDKIQLNKKYCDTYCADSIFAMRECSYNPKCKKCKK